MKFVLSLVLVAYVATAVESMSWQEAMDAMKKFSSPDSYSKSSKSEPSYSEPAYSSSSSYNAPGYHAKNSVYMPMYPEREHKTKHGYSKGYDSDDYYSRDTNEYGKYNKGGDDRYNEGGDRSYDRQAPRSYSGPGLLQGLGGIHPYVGL